jgi:Tfp pilus assembly protein PilV
MERLRENRNSGLTLIEVMIAMLIIMIIVIGAISYMYACMWNAKRADVRITAARIGQLLLETWKITGHYDTDGSGNQIWSWNVTDFDPTDPAFNLTLPGSFSNANDFDLSGIGTELDDYTIIIDGVGYFVTLLFDDNQPRMLSARVGWNLSYSSTNLGSDYMYVDVTSYAIY